jgi:D-threo-aldose 1-dehydrogenase
MDVLAAAVEGQINHFDTSASYGAGTGEARLGRFLRSHDSSKFVISTKVGNNLVDGVMRRSFDPVDMELSLLGSLTRLGIERVDALYLHGPEISDLNDRTFTFFDAQKRAGRIGYAGVESGSLAVHEALIGSPIDIAMIHFSAGDLSSAYLIDRLSSDGKLVVSGTALAQSKFSYSTFVPSSPAKLWYLLRMTNKDPLWWWRGHALAARLRETGREPHSAAIGFVTAHPTILSSLFGSASPIHVTENALAGHQPLDETHYRRIFGDRVGHTP